MLEAVIALFLLLGAFTFLAELYSRSLGHLRRAERNAKAARFAENVDSEMRVWASDPANYRSASWTPFAAYTDPDYPEFKAETTIATMSLPTPCSDFELDRPSSDRALMVDSCRKVQVEILWRTESLFSYTTLVEEPAREVRPTDPVEVRPEGAFSGTVGHDEEVTFVAELMDSANPINDVDFVWSVEAGTGNASIASVSHDGRKAVFKNVYHLRDGTDVYTGGRCRVSATAIYRCTEYRGVSSDIELAL